MKARIFNSEFKGIYTDEFLQNNSSNVINGQLVSEWELTEILPTESYIKTMFDGVNYYEGASIEEIAIHQNNILNENKKQAYNELLPTDWYVIRKLETGIDIPAEILAERQAIRNRYA